MNPTPMNPNGEPLEERVLDELLSADLDGELAAAAADLGLTVEEARDAISSPAAVARGTALARAGDVIGAPVPLDPDEEARLVTASITRGRQVDDLGAARHRHERRTETARRVLVAAGSAAAVIAVIVGLSHGSTSAKDSAGKSALAPTERAGGGTNSAPTGTVAFGDVSNADVLRRRVAARLPVPASPPAPAPQRSVGEPRSTQSTSAAVHAPEYDTSRSAKDSAGQYLLRSRACIPVARHALAVRAAPVLRGTGVSGGRPVFVFVFRRAAGYEAVVMRRADCSVVARRSLP